jgi:outer membrane protein assembly factor BamC
MNTSSSQIRLMKMLNVRRRLAPECPRRLRGLTLTVALLLAWVLPPLLLSGCGSTKKQLDQVLPDRRVEYKRAREAEENLELPPDLAGASFNDALDIPGVGGTTTYSAYSGERAARRQIAGSGEVLPEVAGVSLERTGNQRWLKIDAPPQTVWPRVVSFWRQQGILLTEQDPAIGVMQTDWLENRAEIRKDFVTNVMRKVAGGLYETSTRDQYRVRIDAGPGRGTSEVYLTHRAMEERLVRNTVGEGATTVWEPAPSDPGKEAEMLRRLMLYLGVSDSSANRMLAAGGGSATVGAAGAGSGSGSGARLVSAGGGSELVIPEEFRQAWRKTGLALDRSGFAVEDRDRSAGVFFVRYNDPSKRGEKKGLMSKMAFWKSGDAPDSAKTYQIRVEGDDNESRVTVRDSAGQRDNSATAEQILRLLKDQIR